MNWKGKNMLKTIPTLRNAFAVATAFAVVGAVGCKKKEEKKPAKQEKPVTKAPAPKPPPKPTPKPAPKMDDKADYILVEAAHTDAAKAKNDPVKVRFKAFKVTKSKLDPKNLEGATAEIEVDVTSLDSGVPDRNKHLMAPDFLDSAKFAKATAKVSGVKKAGTKYSANVDISIHGVKAKWPVTFEVVETLPDGVRIKLSHTFKRSAFKIMGDKDNSTKDEVTLKAQLTFKAS